MALGKRNLPVNILAVDDTPGNLIALEAVLGDDYNVVTANSGPGAISLLEKRHDIHLILMDLQMPIMDGFAAAAEIKKIERCRDIPIVFITAVYKEDPFIKKGYEVGGIDYFSKPFDPDVLRLKVGIYASFRQKAEILREREKQLHETEELLAAGRKLASVLESLPVGVLIADTEGRICQTNEVLNGILESLESTEQDAYGKLLAWWESDGQTIKHDLLSPVLSREDDSPSRPVRLRCLDQSEKTVLCSASPLRGLAGELVGAVLVMQDITEHKRVEADFEHRIAKIISLGVELEQSSRQ